METTEFEIETTEAAIETALGYIDTLDLDYIKASIDRSMNEISKKNQNGVYWDLTPDKKLMLFDVETAENVQAYLKGLPAGEEPDLYAILIRGTIIFKDRYAAESFFETELKSLPNSLIHELVEDMLFPDDEEGMEQNTFMIEMDGFTAIIELDQKLIFITNEAIDLETLNAVHHESAE